MKHKRRIAITLGLGGLGVVLAWACAVDPPPPAPPVQALLDLWPRVTVESPTPAQPRQRSEIRFDGSGTLDASFDAQQGIDGLEVRAGRLVGRSNSTSPALLLEFPAPVGGGDQLFAVELRLRVSAGSRGAVQPVLQPGPPLPAVLGRIDAWPVSSALLPGEEMHSYRVMLDHVFLLETPTATADIRQILIRPTDVAGAEFEIESLRLVFDRERLAALDSGPGWHGLGEIFRETLVARAPESLRFDLTLPERPVLLLAVGTVEDPSPSFRISVARPGTPPVIIAELRPAAGLWLPSRVDLAAWASQRVELRLEASAEKAGTLALWGAPTVRQASAPDPAAERPQAVVVFLADTLRADHLQAWGYERDTAPHLTRLASEGVRFALAISQATWTKGSVSSILTSLYPSTTGVVDLHDRIAAGETTLAEAFRAGGYATFATSSVPFTGQLTNLHQGVEVLHETGSIPSSPSGFNSKTADTWVERYLSWLQLHHDLPTFAFIHVMDPHSPFRPRAPFDGMWANEADAESFAEQAEQVRPLIENPLLRRFMAPSGEELAAAGVDASSFVAHEQAWYDGSIRGLDEAFGRLLAGLELQGLRGSTLLAFLSDHGEEFLEHGNHWHGHSVYGEVTHVPWVLWGHGIDRPQVVEHPVETLDLMPTLLDLAGLEVPPRAQGSSLAALLASTGATTEKHALESAPAFSEHTEPGPKGPSSYAMYDRGWKLIWHRNPAPGNPEVELFDPVTDPLDQHDVAAENPAVVASFRPAIERWLSWAESQRLDPEAEQAALSAEDLERLRSLGYVN